MLTSAFEYHGASGEEAPDRLDLLKALDRLNRIKETCETMMFKHILHETIADSRSLGSVAGILSEVVLMRRVATRLLAPLLWSMYYVVPTPPLPCTKYTCTLYAVVLSTRSVAIGITAFAPLVAAVYTMAVAMPGTGGRKRSRVATDSTGVYLPSQRWSLILY